MEKEGDPSNNGRENGAGGDHHQEKTATGIKIRPRKRSQVMKDFEKIVGPLTKKNAAERD
ncbi:MAG TPA: hypothetical protein VF255_07150 [Solirubrobacterales bacterium]